MYEDPILQELYDYREKLAAEFDYDIHRICEYFNQQDLSLDTVQSIDVLPTDKVYPLCLRLHDLENLTDRSELCHELCLLSYATIDPKFKILDIPENVDSPAKLISKLLSLRKTLQKDHLFLIFYAGNPTLELIYICDRLHHYFPLLWISDRPQLYPSFSPKQENLSALVQGWINNLTK